MIILLQSVTVQFRRLFDIFRITKCDKVILLQSMTGCYYKVRQVLQGVTDCYYKMRQVLQSVTVITKWDVTVWIIKPGRLAKLLSRNM